jgi:type I restriction enzyme S subunit
MKNHAPFDWEILPLGEVVKPTRPRIKPSEKPDLPFIGMEHIEAHTMKLLGTVPAGTMKSSAVHFQPEDVLYGRLRPYLNKVYRPDFEGLCSAEFIVFPKTEGVDSRYLQYFLNSSTFASFASHLNTGDRPRVDFDQLAPYAFPVAPPEEQKRIVAEIEKQFSRLDEAVANLKRIKANLKRYKAAVLKAAIEGKLTEDWRKAHPDVEPTSKLLERILTARRTKWTGKGKYKEPALPDTSTLPLLPERWTRASVDQVAEVLLGKMLDKQKHRSGRQLPYLRNINIRWGRVDTNDLLEMFFKDNELERYGLLPGDVLVCEGGEPGRAAVWDGRIPELKYQKALHRVRFSGNTEPRYLVFLLEFLANTGRLDRWFTGSTIKHFTRESFISMPISLPPHPEQKEIVSEVERRLSVIEELEFTVEANLTRAARLRQSVLTKAFSGKLVVVL